MQGAALCARRRLLSCLASRARRRQGCRGAPRAISPNHSVVCVVQCESSRVMRWPLFMLDLCWCCFAVALLLVVRSDRSQFIDATPSVARMYQS